MRQFQHHFLPQAQLNVYQPQIQKKLSDHDYGRLQVVPLLCDHTLFPPHLPLLKLLLNVHTFYNRLCARNACTSTIVPSCKELKLASECIPQTYLQPVQV